MATSYAIDPAPELEPKLEGNKVVFSRVEEDDEKSSKSAEAKDDSNQPQTVDAEDSKASGQRASKSK